MSRTRTASGLQRNTIPSMYIRPRRGTSWLPSRVRSRSPSVHPEFQKKTFAAVNAYPCCCFSCFCEGGFSIADFSLNTSARRPINSLKVTLAENGKPCLDHRSRAWRKTCNARIQSLRLGANSAGIRSVSGIYVFQNLAGGMREVISPESNSGEAEEDDALGGKAVGGEEGG